MHTGFRKQLLNRPGITGDSISLEDGVMNTSKKYSPEVRELAARLVLERQNEHEPSVGSDQLKSRHKRTFMSANGFFSVMERSRT